MFRPQLNIFCRHLKGHVCITREYHFRRVQNMMKCLSKCLHPRSSLYVPLSNKFHSSCMLQNDRVLVNSEHLVNAPTEGAAKMENVQCDQNNADDLMKNLSEEDKKRLLYIQLEIDMLSETNTNIPREISNDVWLQLMELNRNERLRLLTSLSRAEKKAKMKVVKKAVVKEEKEKIYHPSYRPVHPLGIINRFIYRTDNIKTEKKLYEKQRVVHSMLFGPDLIIDLGFEEFMKPRDITLTAKEVINAYFMNVKSEVPFHLKFCNADFNGSIVQNMKSSYSIMYPEDDLANTLATFTERDCHEVVPKKELIYLTSDASEVMKHYNYQATYIIGGLSCKGQKKKLTFAKARMQGIKMVRLPLEKYILWKTAKKKDLSVNQMVSILLELRKTGSWAKTFEHEFKQGVIEPFSVKKMFS